MSVWLVAGLGNPGKRYAGTRHNLGYVLLERLALRERLSWKKEVRFEAELARWERYPDRTVFLVKPLTYVNESGRSLRALADYYKVPAGAVIAVYDDLTLPLGRLKISISGSSGGHNGVASLVAHLGDGFIRVRLGVGPKHPPEIDLKDFVLGRFLPSEQEVVENRLDSFLEGIYLLMDRGCTAAMNILNRRTPKHEPEQEKL